MDLPVAVLYVRRQNRLHILGHGLSAAVEARVLVLNIVVVKVVLTRIHIAFIALFRILMRIYHIIEIFRVDIARLSVDNGR